ncbi:hypothetical protein HDU99_006334, partial [Rhizoclosmatium hyalinum]
MKRSNFKCSFAVLEPAKCLLVVGSRTQALFAPFSRFAHEQPTHPPLLNLLGTYLSPDPLDADALFQCVVDATPDLPSLFGSDGFFYLGLPSSRTQTYLPAWTWMPFANSRPATLPTSSHPPCVCCPAASQRSPPLVIHPGIQPPAPRSAPVVHMVPDDSDNKGPRNTSKKARLQLLFPVDPK